ncbi:hypothetical protein At1g04090-like [Rutidosis leptorrhynchoides]|uniref:hypothetical protein At1g04090-like n=1 Tax=Rutidosis leptorrhynchoides TaxID=125765 RepID=UPI003A990D69
MNYSPVATLILISLFFSCNVATTFSSQDNIHTMFQLPSSVSKSTPHHQGGGFASGSIDLGGLVVTHVTSFKKIWSMNEGGSGTTFYDPVSIPRGFSSLGSYAHPNNIPLFGNFLVAKDVSNNPVKPSLKSPTDYVLKWSSHSLNRKKKDGEAYVWLPIAPYGYKAIGYVITREFNKPSLDKVSCVHVDFTDDHDHIPMKQPNIIPNDDQMTVLFENKNVIDMNGLQVHSSMGGFKIKNERLGKLKANDDLENMPNMTQIQECINKYSPIIYFHPDEEYLPSSVDWFFDSGALLYRSQGEVSYPSAIEKNGANLPQFGPDDETYWLDLPVDDSSKDRVKIGNLQKATSYAHVKPVGGGLFTDITIWVFHPFNGPSTAKVLSFTIPLGKVGEHVGDWEHITLRISNINGELNSVYFARHSWGEWIGASGLEFDENNRIVAYSALHSHGLYARSGDVRYGWVGAKVAGMLDKLAPSDKVMDTSACTVVVAAEYLGGVVVEPPWLNYTRRWGPHINYNVEDALGSVVKMLPWYQRIVIGQIIKRLPKELFSEDGPTGPKAKRSWNRDEELYLVQLRPEAI